MSYRNKTYVPFDAGSGVVTEPDLCNYRLMKAWKNNENIDFNFHDAHDINNITGRAQEAQIKKKLRERFKNAKQFVVIAGKNTKSNTTFVKWEIEIALALKLPIIVAYMNKSEKLDESVCPTALVDENCVHVPFSPKKIKHALDNFPNHYAANKDKEKTNYHYN